MSNAAKTDRIGLRVSKAQKALIASAASASQKDVSEFIIDSVIKQAEETILDQRLFILSDEDFRQLEKDLESKPAENPALAELLSTRAPWES